MAHTKDARMWRGIHCVRASTAPSERVIKSRPATEDRSGNAQSDQRERPVEPTPSAGLLQVVDGSIIPGGTWGEEAGVQFLRIAAVEERIP
jgi:hypothetical protein